MSAGPRDKDRAVTCFTALICSVTASRVPAPITAATAPRQLARRLCLCTVEQPVKPRGALKALPFRYQPSGEVAVACVWNRIPQAVRLGSQKFAISIIAVSNPPGKLLHGIKGPILLPPSVYCRPSSLDLLQRTALWSQSSRAITWSSLKTLCLYVSILPVNGSTR